MYYDFELEQIIKDVSTEWNINPTEKEVFTLIHLYRSAEQTAERIRKQIESEMSEVGKEIDGDGIVDIKPFDEIVQDYFRDKFFENKYKGLLVHSYFNSLN